MAITLDGSNGVKSTKLTSNRDPNYVYLDFVDSATANDTNGDMVLSAYFPIVFKTDLEHERMRIDRQGRVTMPYQPAFCAALTSNSTMSGTTYMPFTTVLQDTGNNLNGGVFTAPVAGTYYMSASLSYDGGKIASDDSAYYGFEKNGTTYVKHLYNPIRWSGVGVENVASISCVVYLNAGDTFLVKHWGVTQTPSPWFIADYCNFSGHLIG